MPWTHPTCFPTRLRRCARFSTPSMPCCATTRVAGIDELTLPQRVHYAASRHRPEYARLGDETVGACYGRRVTGGVSISCCCRSTDVASITTSRARRTVRWYALRTRCHRIAACG